MSSTLVPLLVDSLANAALIFFAAVGLTLVFSVLRVLNVAHGSFYSIGAYVAVCAGMAIAKLGLPPSLSLVSLGLSAALTAAILGPAVEKTLVRWACGKSEAIQILVTFGLFLILEDAQRLVFGVQSFYEDTPVRLLGSSKIGGILYLNYQILLIALAIVVLFGLRFLIRRTRLGMLIVAVVSDREMAQSVGIDINRIFILAFTLGVFLAALGGALAAPISGVAPGLGADTMALAFAVAAIGGLGQIEGAAVAALMVGIVRVLAIYFFPALDAVAPYAAMLIVLLIRPFGLFGVIAARRI